MLVTPVMPMVALDMTGYPPLHERTEGGLGAWLHDQMKMMGMRQKPNILMGYRALAAPSKSRKAA